MCGGSSNVAPDSPSAFGQIHIGDDSIVPVLREFSERIRPCIGAGYCLDRIYVGGDALCLYNPATGHERMMPHVVPARPRPGPRRKVVVVGAGPTTPDPMSTRAAIHRSSRIHGGKDP